ncbi:MAG: DUF302 domain-containing protein [Acidiferrobacteraceae bacterium]
MKTWILMCALLLTVSLPAAADDLFVTVSRHCNYESAVNELSYAIADNKYTLVKIQPVDEGLRHRGYKAPNYKVLFFGDKTQVDRILKDNPQASVIFPLRIMLYQDGDTIVASTYKLDMWKGVFGKDLDPLIDKWDRDVRNILRQYAQQPI